MKTFRQSAILSLLNLVAASLGWRSLGETSAVAAWKSEPSAILNTQTAAKVALTEHLETRNTPGEDHPLGFDTSTQPNLAKAHVLAGRSSDGSGNGSNQLAPPGDRIPVPGTQIALYLVRTAEPLNPVATLAAFVVALNHIFGQNPHAPMLKEYSWSYTDQIFITMLDANQGPGVIPRQPHTYSDVATALGGFAVYMTDAAEFFVASFTVWRTRGESTQSGDAYMVAKGHVSYTATSVEKIQSAVSTQAISPLATDPLLQPTTMATAFLKH